MPVSKITTKDIEEMLGKLRGVTGQRLRPTCCPRVGGTRPVSPSCARLRQSGSGVSGDLADVDVLERHCAGDADLTCSLMRFAASSVSYMSIVSPLSSLIVQYPVTKPGVFEAQGTSWLRSSLSAAAQSLMVTLTTVAVTGAACDRRVAP
jgi:hypothetical protein